MVQHDTLLIACGSQESRLRLRTILQKRFNLLEATNTRQMLLLLEQNLDCIASVVLDITNWDVIDKNLQNDPDAVALLKQTPVIVIADKEAYQDLTLYFRYGAADVIPLNYDSYGMLHRIETITQLTLHRKHLESIVDEQTQHLRHFSDNMVDALSAIIEFRNAESGHHILRIRNFTQILLDEVMQHCPEYGLTAQTISIISSASALHDVGKIGIPDSILTKPGKLTRKEWEVMKTHSVLGCEMLSYLDSTVDQEYMKYAYNICRYHHERWDGTGYPEGLAGEDIPLCAQVVGLTDCYDALTSKRAYKDAFSHSQAVNMILGGECGTFSPKLMECFKNVAHRFEVLSMEYADGRDPRQAIADMSLAKPSEQDEATNLLEKTRAKYYTLVHYLNAFLIEIQLDTGLFQVMYNPFPTLVPFTGANTLENLINIAVNKIVIPEERDRLLQVLQQEMRNFIDQDLRRQSFLFHHRAYDDKPVGPFELTFLRIGGLNRRPSLAILGRITDQPQRRSFQDGSLMENFTECTYVCRNDSGFTLVRTGKDTHSLGGYTPEEVMELFGGRLLDMAFPEDRESIRREFDRQLENGPVVRTEYRFLCKDGSVGWVNNKSLLVMGDDGQEYIQTFLFDITSTKTAVSKLTNTLQRYKTILAQTENVLFDLNVKANSIDFSETWEDIFGYKPSNAEFSRQMSGETHVHPDDLPLLMDRLGLMSYGSDYEMVEIRIATINGIYLWCRVRASAVRDEDGTLNRILGVIINIDSEKQAMQALEDRANRDSLSQLLNKNACKYEIEQYLSRHSQDPQCALLILDLDNFKNVNDQYGHLFGDALITRMAQLLTNLFHSQDVVGRIGGDEFLVLVKGVTDQHLLASQCRRLRDMLLQAFHSEVLDLQLSCSIGIALCPEHGSNYYELFSKADQALYLAKANGKNSFCFYQDNSVIGYMHSTYATTPIDSDRDPSLIRNDITYQIIQVLYLADTFDSAINRILTMMGKRTNVSRVYIFENSEDDSYCTNTFEWCNDGITPEIQNLKHVSYETDIPNYQDNFNENGVFYCHDVHELPQAAYDIVEPQGIQSMLQCIIRHNGKFKGYIGFDECATQRFWTKEEIQVLTYFSEILSMFLMKYREQTARAKQDTLNQQEKWVYVVDPITYQIKHIETTGKSAVSSVQIDQPCYRVLRGESSRCTGCSIPMLQNTNKHWSVVEDPQSHSQILTETSRVNWEGQECIQIICRKLPSTSD